MREQAQRGYETAQGQICSLPQGLPSGLACTCLFLTRNHLKVGNEVIGHVDALNYNGSSYLYLFRFSWNVFYPLVGALFLFCRLQLCALAFNCDGDNGLFCKVIKPKSVVFSNLQWIVNVCDNSQALHTLQQRDWKAFTSIRAKTK